MMPLRLRAWKGFLLVAVTTLACSRRQVSAKVVAVNEENKYLYAKSTDPNAPAVIEVTEPKGFFQTSTKNRIVEFYSPYCGHCTSFAKKYMKVAAQTRDKYGSDTVEFYAVSCAAWSDLCGDFAIQAYPSVYAYPAVQSTGTSSITTTKNTTKVNVGSLLFTVRKVERALGLQRSSVTSMRNLKAEPEEEDEATNEQEDNPTDDEGVREGGDEKIEGSAERDRREDTEDEDNESQRGTARDAPESLTVKKVDDDEASSPDHEFENWKAISASLGRSIRAGAAQARDKPRYMDRFQTEQAQLRQKKRRFARLQNNRSRGEVFTEGATPIMLANRPDTSEFKARQAKVRQILSRMKSRRRQTTTVPLLQPGPLYQKKVARPRLVESLPVVRRIVRMNNEEELILDASLSFLEGLRVGVYKTAGPLEPKKKLALRAWLHLMRVSLPAEWALHDTIDDLMEHFDEISQGSSNLRAILDKHPLPRKQWSTSCQRTNGFNCGFWKLLHIMTVGVAEHRGGQDLIETGMFKSTLSVISPKEAADTLREYMAHFFMCSDCSTHFIAMYDECDLHRRCDRLTDNSKTATDADWKELAKWLWEVHNSVSVRLVNGREDDKRKNKQRAIVLKAAAGPGVASRMDQVQALWPTIDDCALCVNEDGTWDENRVFVHLEATYWPGYDLKDTPRRLISFGDDGDGALSFNLALLLMALVILYLLRSRIAQASVAQTMLLRAKATIRARASSKLRTI